MKAITNLYRESLYMFLQRFVYLGQMVFFGSITNPVGCAVAYRRKYVKELFDSYEPMFGDDLTNSEDIFIGFAPAPPDISLVFILLAELLLFQRPAQESFQVL
jgi:hypothetical protein